MDEIAVYIRITGVTDPILILVDLILVLKERAVVDHIEDAIIILVTVTGVPRPSPSSSTWS